MLKIISKFKEVIWFTKTSWSYIDDPKIFFINYPKAFLNYFFKSTED